jgi:pimeloyl-ACP methyl ester carboxylesterase
MAYAEWGDLDGRPVILLHGNPGSRLFCPDEEATRAAGVRLITMDRPGFGRSDPRPGAALLDWPDDYLELAGQLDLPPSPVIGWSSGGRFALALGFRAPDLVSVVGVAAGRGPIDEVPGALDALSLGDQAIVALLADDRAAGMEAIAKDGAWLEGDVWETMFDESFGEADDRVLADPTTLTALKAMVREGVRQGSAGDQTDSLAAWTPWGFSANDIRQPVHLWWGEADLDTPRTGLDYLAATIPHASLVTYPGEGHFLPISRWGELLAAVH